MSKLAPSISQYSVRIAPSKPQRYLQREPHRSLANTWFAWQLGYSDSPQPCSVSPRSHGTTSETTAHWKTFHYGACNHILLHDSNIACRGLVLHFIYFQLPMRSRAISYFHPMSFITSIVIITNYITLLIYFPDYEMKYLESYDLNKSTLFLRNFCIYVSPCVLHLIDITWNQELLILSYEFKPWKIYILWSIICYPLFGTVFEFTFPESENTEYDISEHSHWVSFIATAFALLMLYFLIFRKIFSRRFRGKSF